MVAVPPVLPLVILASGQRSRRTTLLLLHQYSVQGPNPPFPQGMSIFNFPETSELLSYLRYHTYFRADVEVQYNLRLGAGKRKGEQKERYLGYCKFRDSQTPDLIGEYFGLPSNRGRFRMGEHGYHKTRPSDILR